MIKTLLILLLLSLPALANSDLSDSQVKHLMIEDSISSYKGNCPCPYNLASNGSACGRRSAYSRPGGYAPICYPNDVTPSMISKYKRMHGIR